MIWVVGGQRELLNLNINILGPVTIRVRDMAEGVRNMAV